MATTSLGRARPASLRPGPNTPPGLTLSFHAPPVPAGVVNPAAPAFTDQVLGQLWTPTASPVVVRGAGGPAVQFDGVANFYATTGYASPSDRCTVLLKMFVPASGVSQNGSTFGTQDTPAPNILQAHVGYSGVVYWDYGSIGTPGRVSWTPPGAWWGDYHRVAFVMGPVGGQAVWSDGQKMASGPVGTRTPASPVFTVGQWTNLYFNTNVVEELLVFSAELSDSAIRRWSTDPYCFFRVPKTATNFFGVSAPVPAGAGPPRLWRRTFGRNR